MTGGAEQRALLDLLEVLPGGRPESRSWSRSDRVLDRAVEDGLILRDWLLSTEWGQGSTEEVGAWVDELMDRERRRRRFAYSAILDDLREAAVAALGDEMERAPRALVERLVALVATRQVSFNGAFRLLCVLVGEDQERAGEVIRQFSRGLEAHGIAILPPSHPLDLVSKIATRFAEAREERETGRREERWRAEDLLDRPATDPDRVFRETFIADAVAAGEDLSDLRRIADVVRVASGAARGEGSAAELLAAAGRDLAMIAEQLRERFSEVPAGLDAALRGVERARRRLEEAAAKEREADA